MLPPPGLSLAPHHTNGENGALLGPKPMVQDLWEVELVAPIAGASTASYKAATTATVATTTTLARGWPIAAQSSVTKNDTTTQAMGWALSPYPFISFEGSNGSGVGGIGGALMADGSDAQRANVATPMPVLADGGTSGGQDGYAPGPANSSSQGAGITEMMVDLSSLHALRGGASTCETECEGRRGEVVDDNTSMGRMSRTTPQ